MLCVFTYKLWEAHTLPFILSSRFPRDFRGAGVGGGIARKIKVIPPLPKISQFLIFLIDDYIIPLPIKYLYLTFNP